MSRTALAFLVAPLWVPAAAVIFAAHAFPHAEQWHWIVITTVIAAVFAYAGVAALGVPAFLLLRARRYTAFWIALLLGLCIGVITGLIFVVAFGLSLGNGWAFVLQELTNSSGDWRVFLPTGGLGAIVGATLWLIARPDREH